MPLHPVMVILPLDLWIFVIIIVVAGELPFLHTGSFQKHLRVRGRVATKINLIVPGTALSLQLLRQMKVLGSPCPRQPAACQRPGSRGPPVHGFLEMRFSMETRSQRNSWVSGLIHKSHLTQSGAEIRVRRGD